MHLGKGWLCEVSIGPVGQTDYAVSKAGRTQTAVFREYNTTNSIYESLVTFVCVCMTGE